jgi:DNA-binding NtrC family response regulator
MKTPLQIVHLEHDPNDARRVQAGLEAEGIACTVERVESRADFVAALERRNVDLILSDFSLAAFDGLSALEIARTNHPNIPFIIVSGTTGEESAIESLKHGATDYVPKQHLQRIVPAVTRAIQEVEARTERRRLEEQFIEAQTMGVIGQLASGVAREHQGPPIRLVITDVVMPQLGGKVMAEWLKSHYPDLEISFTSGYTEDAIGYNGNESLGSGAAFLSKPYTTPSLLAKYVR